MRETRVLADYVAGLSYSDLPAEVVLKTKDIISDIVACGLAGRRTLEGDILVDIMKEIGGKQECTVFNEPAKFSCVQAAQVNRVLTNILDYDDTIIEHMTGHISTVLVPVALAIGEHVDASGKEIIAALIPAYDVVFRLREAVNPSPEAFVKSFRERIDSGAGLGVAAVAGKLLGLSGKQMADAFGLTGRVRTWRVPHQDKYQAKGGMARWMKVTGGDVVVPGIHAAFLALRGFPGEHGILDQGRGYEAFVGSDSYDATRLTAGLGKSFAVMKVGFKFYSACRLTCSTLDAVAAIVSEHGIKAEDVAQVKARVQQEVAENFAVYEPEYMIHAQFSLPYLVAMLLLGEPTGPNWYTEDKLGSQQVRELQYKVRLEEDPEATRAGWGGEDVKPMSTVEITLKDGRSFSRTVTYPRGEPQNPFTRQDHMDKLKNMASCVEMDQDRINELMGTLDRLEEVDSVSELTRLLVP